MLAGVAVVAAGFGGWHLLAGARASIATLDGRRALQPGARCVHAQRSGRRRARSPIGWCRNSVAAPTRPGNLAAARVQTEAQQFDQAAARLLQVMQHTHDPALALVARLRLARVQLAQNKPDDAIKTLDAVPPGAFSARYAEVRGDALLAKGDRAGALKQYRAARASGADTRRRGIAGPEDQRVGALVRALTRWLCAAAVLPARYWSAAARTRATSRRCWCRSPIASTSGRSGTPD